MALTIIVNGNDRQLDSLVPAASLSDVIRELALQSDRIAVEHNGEIARRANWDHIHVQNGDRLEIVHFVGGGSEPGNSAGAPQ